MPAKPKATIGGLDYTKSLHLDKLGKTLTMNLWDVSGQDKFRAIVSMYYRDADGAVIVYDVTDPKSFEDVEFWLQELHDKAPTNLEIALVGNKTDLVE